MKLLACSIAVALAGCSSLGAPADTAPPSGASASVSLPGGAIGIGLDDLRFSTRLGRIVVAAGRTGAVDLVDPKTNEVTSVGGFSSFDHYNGGDQQGVESADEGRGFVFAVDRAAYVLGVVDPAAKALVASVQLERTEPDYVRWVEPTSEVWITNPGASRIDVLAVGAGATPAPVHAAFIDVPGGVEGLAIDAVRKRAYTHSSWGIAVVDLQTRKVLEVWRTGCRGEHGIPVVDEERGFVFAGCASSEVVVLDAKAGGAVVGRHALGTGTTILAYSQSLHHFYLRGDPGPTVVVLGIGSDGVPRALGSFESASRGHCATADDRGNVWLCDAVSGRLLRFADPHPATP